MKMDHRNPPGEKPDMSMGGNHKYQASGKGDLKPFTPHVGMGSLGGSMGGNEQKTGHVKKSFAGSTVSTTHTAAK